MQTIIDHLPLGIFWKDSQGLYLGANRYALLRNSDLKLEFLLGRNDYSMPWCAKAQQIQEIDNLIITSKRAYETRDMFEFGFDKEPISDMYCLKLPLFQQDIICGILGLAVNISNKKYRDNMSEPYYNQILYLETFKQLRYDCKEAINAIVGSMNLANFWLSRNNKEEVSAYIERTQNTAIALAGILSRHQQIECHNTGQEFYIFDIVQDEISMAQSLIYPYQKVDLLYHIDPLLPKRIKKDSYKFSLLLRHLLSNSIKFTPQGSIKVELLSGYKLNNSQRLLILQVQDTGLGVSVDIQKKIKMSFLSPESHSLKKYHGLQTIITNTISLGGFLTCNSSPNQGSTFRIEFTLD